MDTRLICLRMVTGWCAALGLAVSPVAAQDAAPQKRPLPIPVKAGPRAIECVVTFGPAIPVAAIAFSPDGKRLAVAGYHEVVIWDLENARLARRIGAGQWATVGALAFLPDGQLAVGEGTPYGDGSVRLVNVDDGEQIHRFDEPDDGVYALAASPDGKLLAAGGGDRLARVWTLADRKLAATLKEHNGQISGIAFSRDGKRLATASLDKTVQVWEVGTWTRTIKFREKEPVHGAVFGSDPKMVFLAVGGATQRSITYRRTDNVRYVRAFSTGVGMPLGIVWDAKTNRMIVPCSDGIVRAMDANGRTLATYAGDKDWIYAAALSPDGARLAAGSGDGTVKIWHVAEKRLLATLIQLAPRTDDWLIVTAQGYLAASATGAVAWKGDNLKTTPEQLIALLQKPDLVQQTLAGKKVKPPAIP